jgi:hypothetical protein
MHLKMGFKIKYTLSSDSLHIFLNSDKPKKATVYHEKINIEGNNTTLTCTSISTTYPTNHTLNLTYNWKLNTVTNPPNARYVYSLNRNTIFIESIGKEDANASITCSATESGDDVIGFTSDESEKSLLVVYCKLRYFLGSICKED